MGASPRIEIVGHRGGGLKKRGAGVLAGGEAGPDVGVEQHERQGGDVERQADQEEVDAAAVAGGFAVAVAEAGLEPGVQVVAGLLGEPAEVEDALDDDESRKQDQPEAGDDEGLGGTVGAGDDPARKSGDGDDGAAEPQQDLGAVVEEGELPIDQVVDSAEAFLAQEVEESLGFPVAVQGFHGQR